MRLKRISAALMAVAVVSGAIATGQARPAKGGNRLETAAQRQGLAFAQEHCSICHAIDTGISPKPEAPSFEAIINTHKVRIAWACGKHSTYIELWSAYEGVPFEASEPDREKSIHLLQKMEALEKS